MKKILNVLKNPKVKMVIILTFLLFIYTSICAISYAQNISTDIASSVFRLHVIANSDSKEDQDLKYKVRDNLLKYMNKICKDCTSKEEAISLVEKNKDIFKQIALDTIRNEGFSYDVNINIGNFEFPTKNYGDISLPAGLYDALRVEIGEAKGQNWWCVMFPPLCFIDDQNGIIDEKTDKKLKEVLTEEEYDLIMAKNKNEVKNLEFKFKITEVFQNIF